MASALSDLSPALLSDLLLGTVASSVDLAVLETALRDRTLVARTLEAYPSSAAMTLRTVAAQTPSSAWLAERLGARFVLPRAGFRRADDSRVTTLGNELHSFDDRPAVAGPLSAIWYAGGALHRDDDRVAAVRLKASPPAFRAAVRADGSRMVCTTLSTAFARDNGRIVFEWRKHGQVHREGDRPAVVAVSLDGTRLVAFWARDGMLHRGRDRPAIVEYVREKLGGGEGEQEAVAEQQHGGVGVGGGGSERLRVVGQRWFRRGMRHRSGGRPSVDIPGAHRMWHRHDTPSRADGLPTAVEFAHRTAGLRWEDERGALHRDGDLPAAVYASGPCEWFRGGNLHRMGDKPAVVDGGNSQSAGRCEWFVLGRRIPGGSNDEAVVAAAALAEARAFVRHARQVVAAESAASAAAAAAASRPRRG